MATLTVTRIQECLTEMQMSDQNEYDILASHFSELELTELLTLAMQTLLSTEVKEDDSRTYIMGEKNKTQAINLATEYET